MLRPSRHVLRPSSSCICKAIMSQFPWIPRIFSLDAKIHANTVPKKENNRPDTWSQIMLATLLPRPRFNPRHSNQKMVFFFWISQRSATAARCGVSASPRENKNWRKKRREFYRPDKSKPHPNQPSRPPSAASTKTAKPGHSTKHNSRTRLKSIEHNSCVACTWCDLAHALFQKTTITNSLLNNSF